MYALNYLKFSRLPVQVVQVVAVPLMKDTDTDSLEDRIDSIEKSAKVERVKDCDKMKVAKGKVNLYLTCICFGIR